MSSIKIKTAQINERGRWAARQEAEMVLEVEINQVYGECRILSPQQNYYNDVAGMREYAIRNMAATIASRIESEIIEALRNKAREARPVHISDAFKSI